MTAPSRLSAPFRTPRRRVAVASLSVAAVLSGVLLFAGPGGSGDEGPETPPWSPLTVTVAGDLDGDDKVTAAEKKEAQVAEETAWNLAGAFLGEKRAQHVTNLLVTPPGDLWWQFVGAQTLSMRLYDVPAPEDANWYSVSWAQSANEQGTGRRIYPAMHVAFKDPMAAGAWAGRAASHSYVGVKLVGDGSVVMVTPIGVNPLAEKVPAELADIVDVKQTTGYWSIDYGKKVDVESHDLRFEDAYRKFWTGMGFDDVKWTAVARDPRRWVGKISGWDPEDVDLAKATKLMGRGNTEDTSGPLQPALDAMFVQMGEEYEINDLVGPPFAGQQMLFPVNDTPEGYDMLMTFDSSFYDAFLGSGDVQWGSPYPYTVQWIYGDTMALEARPRPATPTQEAGGENELPRNIPPKPLKPGQKDFAEPPFKKYEKLEPLPGGKSAPWTPPPTPETGQ